MLKAQQPGIVWFASSSSSFPAPPFACTTKVHARVASTITDHHHHEAIGAGSLLLRPFLPPTLELLSRFK